MDLTGEEHYVAHQLLVRIYPGHIGIAYAAVKMAWQTTGNKPYGWLKLRYSKSRKGVNYQRGTKRSAETRARMSVARKGIKFPNRKRGYVFTPEHRANLSAARVGKKRNPEIGKKVGASQKGKVVSEATREKLSVARRRRVTSLETRAKMSATRLGRKTGPTSPEVRAKLSLAMREWWAGGKGKNQWTIHSSSAS